MRLNSITYLSIHPLPGALARLIAVSGTVGDGLLIVRRQNATHRRTVGAWSGVFGDADEHHPPIRRGHQLGDQRHRALRIWRRIESDHDPSHTSRPLSDHQDGALGASHDAARHAAHQQPLRGAMTAPAHCNQVSAKSLRFVENSFDGSLIDNTSFRTRPSSCQRSARPRGGLVCAPIGSVPSLVEKRFGATLLRNDG